MLNNTFVNITEVAKNSFVGEVFLDGVSDGEIEIKFDYGNTNELSLDDMREMITSKWIALEEEFQINNA